MRVTRWLAAALVLSVVSPALAQEWDELVFVEDRFKVNFPGKPRVEETTWVSQYRYTLPSRVYRAARGAERYSVTVVDYRPIEKLGVERSKACPPGAETCIGNQDGRQGGVLGLGYWKMDVRGAMAFAIFRLLQRDTKLTDLTLQFQDLVEGYSLQLTNPDASRTFAYVTMHENRLYIFEGTTPKGYPDPALFQGSVGFVDEKGSGIRYVDFYANGIHGLRQHEPPAARVGGVLQGEGQQQFAQPQPLREVTVTGIPGVVAAGAPWTLAWSGTDNADGITAMPDGSLLFAQEQPSRVTRIHPDGTLSIAAESTRGAGSVAVDPKGRLIAVQRTCTDPGLRTPCAQPTMVSIVSPDGERRTLADQVQGKPLARPSDLVVSRNGGVYFTATGAFYIPPGGAAVSIGQNLRANGIMLSPEEKTLYVTNGPIVVAFDVRPDGTAANQRDFARMPAGNADGLAVDAAGRLYVASGAAGVQVFSPDGKHLGVIPTPRAAASLAFAGPDKKTLYITSAGALDAAGREIRTPPGVRNNAKSIFRIPMLAEGYKGRPK